MQGMMRMMSSIPRMINGMREGQAKAALEPIVKYVVGNTATPSPEMVNFAVIAGSAPVTQTEKDAYLAMMKKVARRTPEVIMQFLKLEKNGSYVLDEFKLDAHITKRAMQFSIASKSKKERKLKEKEKTRKEELDRLRMMQDHELNLLKALGHGQDTTNTGQGQNTIHAVSTPGPFDTGFFTYDVYGGGPVADFGVVHHDVAVQNNPVPVNTQVQPKPVSNTRLTGSFSLLDMMRNHNKNNNNNNNFQGSNNNTTVTSEVQTHTFSPTASPDMMAVTGSMDYFFGL